MAYVYRLKPRIDLSLIGLSETHILKTFELAQMTRAYVVERFRRGHYMLDLSDANRPKGQQKVCRTWFEIDDPEVGPPVYDPRTLCLAEPQNADEVSRLLNAGVLVRDSVTGAPRLKTEDSAAAAPAAAASLPNTPALQQENGSNVPEAIAASLTGRLLDKLVDRAIPALAPQSPAEMLKMAFEIADKFRIVAPPSVPPPSVDEIAARLEERMNRNQPVTAPSAPADPVESAMKSIETAMKFQELMEKIGGKNGGGHGKPRWFESLPQIFEGAKELIPEVVRGVGQVRQMYSTPQNGKPANGVYSPVAQSEPVQHPQAEFLPTAATDGHGTAANGENSGIATGFMGHLRFMLGQYRDGVRGYDTAVFLVKSRPGGLEVFRQIDALEPEDCISMLAMSAEGRELLADPAGKTAVRTWLEDFTCFDADEQDQDESESPEVTATAGA
jgi:hypothetical protein